MPAAGEQKNGLIETEKYSRHGKVFYATGKAKTTIPVIRQKGG